MNDFPRFRVYALDADPTIFADSTETYVGYAETMNEARLIGASVTHSRIKRVYPDGAEIEILQSSSSKDAARLEP